MKTRFVLAAATFATGAFFSVLPGNILAEENCADGNRVPSQGPVQRWHSYGYAIAVSTQVFDGDMACGPGGAGGVTIAPTVTCIPAVEVAAPAAAEAAAQAAAQAAAVAEAAAQAAAAAKVAELVKAKTAAEAVATDAAGDKKPAPVVFVVDEADNDATFKFAGWGDRVR